MMNPQDNQKVTFREGDVVARDSNISDSEYRIVAMTTAGPTVEWLKPGEKPVLQACSIPWDGRWKLLRRPVRVGDKLTCSSSGARYTLVNLGDECAACTHADGTPIEPPQKPAEAPRGELLAIWTSETRAAAEKVMKYLADDRVEPSSVADTIDGAEHRRRIYIANTRAGEAEARANRLADELQPLRDERDRLQRRCDALELQMRRAGIVPKDGGK